MEKSFSEELKQTLKNLAQKYEVPEFCNEDPSQFLRWYKLGIEEETSNTAGNKNSKTATIYNHQTRFGTLTDVETASFIAAMLAFGNRKQFIPKISYILDLADKTSGSITKWITSGAYKTAFSKSEKKFYRFYSYKDMHDFFGDLATLVGEGEKSQQNKNEAQTWGYFGEAIRLRWENAQVESEKEKIILADIISAAFPNSKIVPKGKNTANKRIHMFLRWMVRQNSPVDLGLWKWYSPAELLIPLDVHVMEEGIRLGALPEKARATRKTAIELTESLKEIWPGDPCKGDFALFGLGVDEEK